MTYSTTLTVNNHLNLPKESIETTTSPHVTQGVAIERFEQLASNHGHFSTTKSRRLLNADRPFLSTIELHASRKFVSFFFVYFIDNIISLKGLHEKIKIRHMNIKHLNFLMIKID